MFEPVWETIKWTWQNRDDIRGIVRGLRNWFRTDSERGILIIGPGGVGKTTLARILSDDVDWLFDDAWQYSESFGIEHTTLKDDPKIKIVIPPGQHRRRETTWTEIEANLAKGEYRGVIVVTANGFHTLPRQSFKHHKLYQGNKDQFFAAYREASHQDGMNVFQRICTAMRNAPKPMWLFSVVTKQDLWFTDTLAVEREHTDGRFGEMARELANHRGDRSFRYESLGVSLVISNLVTSENELLAKTVAGYDQQRQITSIRRLFEILQALVDWESKS